jgi:hypothetical protein
MRVPTFRLAAGCAVTSMALMVGGLALAYMNQHLVPAGMRWSFSDFFGEVVNLAVPVVGLVLASRRPANPVGWIFLVAGLALGLSAFSDQYGLRALVAVAIMGSPTAMLRGPRRRARGGRWPAGSSW